MIRTVCIVDIIDPILGKSPERITQYYSTICDVLQCAKDKSFPIIWSHFPNETLLDFVDTNLSIDSYCDALKLSSENRDGIRKVNDVLQIPIAALVDGSITVLDGQSFYFNQYLNHVINSSDSFLIAGTVLQNYTSKDPSACCVVDMVDFLLKTRRNLEPLFEFVLSGINWVSESGTDLAHKGKNDVLSAAELKDILKHANDPMCYGILPNKQLAKRIQTYYSVSNMLENNK